MRSRAYENSTVNMAYLKSSHIVPEETKNKPKLLKITNLIQRQDAITISPHPKGEMLLSDESALALDGGCRLSLG